MAPVSQRAPLSLLGSGTPLAVLAASFLLLLLLLQEASGSATRIQTAKFRTITDGSANEIEEFVKKLEYEAINGLDNLVDDGEVISVDLNLLADEAITQDIEDGIEEEFTAVDKELGENSTKPVNSTAGGPQSRHLSLIYQGVYAPDSRFNAFVDGVMVNMVAEMKRKKMDPLYFRVYDRGIIEHVSTRAGRNGGRNETTPAPSNTTESSPAREGRQRGSAIGGGVIRGLTNIKRFGNAEVQIAGNTTLVRSHYVYGPLNIELVFHTEKGVKTINSTLTALAAHAVAEADGNSSKLIDFIIDSPAEYEVRLMGARSQRYQRISQSAVMRLFKPTGRLERRLKRVYIRSRSRRIPDVIARNQRRNNRRNGNRRASEKEASNRPNSE